MVMLVCAAASNHADKQEARERLDGARFGHL
jgi:hypothetical protein